MRSQRRTLKKYGGDMLNSFTKYANKVGTLAKQAKDAGNKMQNIQKEIRNKAEQAAVDSGLLTTPQKIVLDMGKRNQQKLIDAKNESEAKALNSFTPFGVKSPIGGSRPRRYKKTAKNIKRKSKKTKRSRR